MKELYRGLFQAWEIGVAMNLIGEFQERWPCLQTEDVEDLLQECLISWSTKKNQYDAQRGASKKTFMAWVVRCRLQDLVKEKGSHTRRIASVTVSLDEPLGDSDDSPRLIDAIESGALGAAQSDPTCTIQLRLDLKKAITQLPEYRRRLCQLLYEEGLTVQEVSARLNVPRSSVYDELKRIGEVFEKAGLENYFK